MQYKIFTVPLLNDGQIVEEMNRFLRENSVFVLLQSKYRQARQTGCYRFRARFGYDIRLLRQQLQTEETRVGNYHYFTIYDPKQRTICAAAFREMVLHHALMNICHPYFDRHLIADSYATRIWKGVYVAIDKAFPAMCRYQYVCKLDVRKYFDSISYVVLKQQLCRLFKDASLLKLFEEIIDSYAIQAGYGIPIGNLTSQYFANHYLSAFDHYAKEQLQIPVYIRYMDDILLFGNDKETMKIDVTKLAERALTELELNFKPCSIRNCRQGVFLQLQIMPGLNDFIGKI